MNSWTEEQGTVTVPEKRQVLITVGDENLLNLSRYLPRQLVLEANTKGIFRDGNDDAELHRLVKFFLPNPIVSKFL